MKDYFEQSALKDLLLEDSWVLDIAARRGNVAIRALFALTPDHPNYSPPPPSDYNCYRTGVLAFEGVTSLSWTDQLRVKPAGNADGTIDFGTIDECTINGDSYYLNGAFGTLDIVAAAIKVTLGERR